MRGAKTDLVALRGKNRVMELMVVSSICREYQLFKYKGKKS